MIGLDVFESIIAAMEARRAGSFDLMLQRLGFTRAALDAWLATPEGRERVTQGVLDALDPNPTFESLEASELTAEQAAAMMGDMDGPRFVASRDTVAHMVMILTSAARLARNSEAELDEAAFLQHARLVYRRAGPPAGELDLASYTPLD